MTYAPGQALRFRSGDTGKVRWVATPANSSRAASWGEDLITVEISIYRGRKHWTELTEFRESTLREALG